MNTNMNAVPVTSEKVRTSSGEQPPPMHEKNAGGGANGGRGGAGRGANGGGGGESVGGGGFGDGGGCRPFRRFNRFYSGERKPGDDASD